MTSDKMSNTLHQQNDMCLEVSGTDSARHVRHPRCPRPMSEFRHVPFWVRHHCLASVWPQSIQPAPDSSQTHPRQIFQVLPSLSCLVTVYPALIRQQPDTPQTHITDSSGGLRSHQTQVIQTYNWAAHRYNWYCRTCTTIQLPTLWKAAKTHPPGHPTEKTMVVS